ncbi:TPA: hypothetical protein I8303_004503 [Aeromonas hydrophila]|nr:hypothetical protein [Aeromonas hydrophila]
MNNSLLDVLKKAREQLKQQLQQEPEVGHGPRFDEIHESGMEAKSNLHRSMRP